MKAPAELTAALTTDAGARALFARFAPSHQREYVKWVGEAKQAATRQNRARKAVAQMKEKAVAQPSSRS
ncbi:MAG TPA: YdeI/OmpD-associated family protein [Opitutaceae bacterium]|nr:YdeI/OmpD-associated family protein [Opitutaceae bacterium]